MMKTSVSFFRDKDGTPHIKGNLPESWHDMTSDQLLYVCTMIALGTRMSDLKIYAFIRFCGMKICAKDEKGNWIAVYRKGLFGREYFTLTEDLVSWGANLLSFLDHYPSLPLRLEKVNSVKAIDAYLHGVKFSSYLVLENLWQRVLANKDDSAIDAMCRILYPGSSKPNIVMKSSAMLWFSSFKDFCRTHWPHLFKLADGSKGEAPDMEHIMNAQIRGLTQGDVTKEKEVMDLDVWRALTELDAKAEEAAEARAEIDKLKSK